MRLGSPSLLVLFAGWLWHTLAIYVPLREYRGVTFFDGWDYYGNVDNTTWGNVTYVDETTGVTRRLTFVNNEGNAIIRVDNTTNIANATLVNRPSVRLTSQEAYGVGTLWVIDVAHLPYGCSVWPAFWSLGADKEWPYSGEIDVIEGINLMKNNQMALHTTPGCVQARDNGQTGNTLDTDCSTPQGCVVAENRPNSYGQSFALAGGGVWVVQMDISGIYMWYWSRPDLPPSIRTANSGSSLDTVAFGPPSASFPASTCNITQFFGPQKLVLSITLCGVWAGVPGIYASTCPGHCVYNNIIGPGSPTYDTAYFEIPYIRIYTASEASTSSPLPSGPTPTTKPSTRTTLVFQTTTRTPEIPTSSTAPILAPGLLTLLSSFMVILWTTAG